MPTPPKFQFYEHVRVHPARPEDREAAGLCGAVLGRTEAADGWSYGVFLFALDRVWCFAETELESTGHFGRREDFYSGESFRVRVDAAGRGHLVPGQPAEPLP